MERPGLQRALPGAIVGFFVGAIIVMAIRAAQGLDPIFASGPVLVLTPFTVLFGWLWGVGAFNPAMSEHGDHGHDEAETAIVPADEAAHEPEAATPFGLLMNQTWRVTTFTMTILVIFYVFAALPTGLYLQTTDDPSASPLGLGDMMFTLPFFGEVVVNQLVVLLGFFAFTILSVVVTAGIIGFLLVFSHEQVAQTAKMEPKGKVERPRAPMRWIGRQSRAAARGLRNGLPKVFGMK